MPVIIAELMKHELGHVTFRALPFANCRKQVRVQEGILIHGLAFDVEVYLHGS